MGALAIASLAGANTHVHQADQQPFWNLVMLSRRCTQDSAIFFVNIYSRMQVKPSSQPVVLSIPICHYDDTESAKASRRQLKEAIYKVLFDMNVPAVGAVNQATLALYAARRTSGFVVNIGFQVTSIVPILNGKVMRKVGVEVMGLGALKLTGFLRELLQQSNINFDSLYTVWTVKEETMHGSRQLFCEEAPHVYQDSQLSTFPGPWCVTKKQFRQKSRIKRMW
ncbi:hypothetical protein TB2_005671 [Malus domestica]